MKRVLRSCITPLPRFLTTRALAGLVLVLVAGTALSVHEYLETARAPRATQVRTQPVRSNLPGGEVRAAERTSSASRTHPACTLDFSPSAEALPASSSSASSTSVGARPATLYGPDAATSGT